MSVLVVGACASTSESTTSVADAELFAGAIAEASIEGASLEQVDTLRAAAERGEVTYEDARRAAELVMTCVEAVGISAEYSEYDLGAGYLVPGVAAYAPSPGLSDTQLGMVEACEFEHAWWISKVYQLQSQARSSLEQFYEASRGELVACLRTQGSEVDPDLPMDELRQEAINLADPEVAESNCLRLLGLG